MFDVDWQALFVPSVSIAETILRGSVVYWFLFCLFRFALRRDVGSVGIADVLVLVIIADASQNAMAGEYTSITDGLILVVTIVFWNYLLDYLSFRFPKIARFAQSPPICLVRDGRFVHRNMRKEFLTEDELMGKLREKGVEDLAKVKNVYIEEDGANQRDQAGAIGARPVLLRQLLATYASGFISRPHSPPLREYFRPLLPSDSNRRNEVLAWAFVISPRLSGLRR